MASTPLAQVPPEALDLTGLSVCTATPELGKPRAGTAYNVTDFAAAAPIWFHPVADGRFVMSSARRWFDVAPDGGIPGSFSSFSEDLEPSWVLLDGPSGRRSPIPGFPITIPTNTTVVSRVLTAAASVPPSQFYLLNAVVIGEDPAALVQRFAVSTDASVTLGIEEVAPSVVLGEDNTVVFDKGLLIEGQWLHLYGTDAVRQVYRIRKPWAHLGVNKPVFTAATHVGQVVGPQGWEYFTGSGYSLDVTEMAVVRTATGVLTTAGPMSFGSYRTGTLVTTVEESGGTYTGRVWRAVVGRPLHKGEAIALGSTGYLGGGVQLQPLVAAANALGADTTIPYLTSTRIENGATRLGVSWGLLSVTG